MLAMQRKDFRPGPSHRARHAATQIRKPYPIAIWPPQVIGNSKHYTNAPSGLRPGTLKTAHSH